VRSTVAAVVIRRIAFADFAAVRALRLRALATDPLAFGSTLAREVAFTEAEWDHRLRTPVHSPDQALWVAEIDPDGLVGMIGVLTVESRFHVVGMWVDPGRRRAGLGGALLDTLLSWTTLQQPARPVVLSVNPSQVGAVQLYLSRGFYATGIVEPLDHTPGAVLHEMIRASPGAKSISGD
jgi:ribosomal protein S18 acetylase RimI-like enzyme